MIFACGPAQGVSWTALSRGLHFNRQFETGTSDLVLKRQPYKLSFALVERLRKTRCPLRANRSPPLLNITEVRPRDTKKLCELGKASLVGLAQARKGCPQRQRPSHKGFEELRRPCPDLPLCLLSNHVC